MLPIPWTLAPSWGFGENILFGAQEEYAIGTSEFTARRFHKKPGVRFTEHIGALGTATENIETIPFERVAERMGSPVRGGNEG